MLLQTNSYIVPRDKRAEHARLMRRFRQSVLRLGCDHFEVFEQAGANWSNGETTGRFVQIMRFRDRKHQLQVQAAERNDPTAQALIQEFCELINFPYQQQQGLFAVGFYSSVLPVAPPRARPSQSETGPPAAEPTPPTADAEVEADTHEAPDAAEAEPEAADDTSQVEETIEPEFEQDPPDPRLDEDRFAAPAPEMGAPRAHKSRNGDGAEEHAAEPHADVPENGEKMPDNGAAMPEHAHEDDEIVTPRHEAGEPAR